MEITTREDAEFIGPPVNIMPVNEEEEEEKSNAEFIYIVPGENDVEAMARFARENSQYVQYMMEFFWKRDHEMKKAVKKEDEAGPSMVINLSSKEEEFTSDQEETLAYWNSIDIHYVSDE